MMKPHWRCLSCDASRYKVNKDGSVTCYSCGTQDRNCSP